MSQNIGPIVEILLRRIRQEGGFALDVNLATKIYSLCEQITNAATRRILVSTTFLIPKQKLVFHFRSEFPDAIDIVSLSENSRDIPKANSLADFSAYSSTWFRTINGTRFESWFQLGRDILILYPGQVSISSLSITYVKLLTLHTDFVASYNITSELPDEDIDLALSLAELVLLCRFRLLPSIPPRFEKTISLFQSR